MSPTVPVQRSTTGAANVLLTQHVFPSARQKSSPWLFMQHVAGVPHTPQKNGSRSRQRRRKQTCSQRVAYSVPGTAGNLSPSKLVQHTPARAADVLPQQVFPAAEGQEEGEVEAQEALPARPASAVVRLRAAASRSRARGYGVPAAAALPSSGLDPGSGWC